MKPNSQCGEVVTTVILVLALCGVGGVMAGWRPLEFLKPKPPVAELNRLQAQLEANQAAATAALKARDAAVATERAKLEQEIRTAQQDALGTYTALARVPADHRTAEVKLAASMATRVTLKLAAAIGELPKEQQAAMVALIEQALSDKQAEVDAALVRLAQRDAAFATLAKEKDAVAAQIPILTAEAVKAKETALATQAKVTEKTNEVAAIAVKLDAKDREKGSIGAALDRVIFWGCIAAGAYFLLAVVGPGLVKHMDSGPLKNGIRHVCGFLTSPVLYWDAAKKLTGLFKQTNPPFPPREHP